MVGGTFAKYTSTVAGSDSARVAKFDFDVKSGTDALTKTGTDIDLFATVNDTGVYTDASGKNVNTEKLVAPGVEGSFGLVVTNRSEVAVKANLTITETAANGTDPNTVPIIYAYTDPTADEVTFWSGVLTDKTQPILLHELAAGKVADTVAAAAKDKLTAAEFASAKKGELMVKLSGDLEELAKKINDSKGTQLAPTSPTEAKTELDLASNFSWFWAYEIYTQKTVEATTVWVPDDRDTVDTAMVWDDASNKTKASVPDIKVKLDVNITQMDTYIAPSPAP
ncbi:hypothetical protein [Allofournierella sp.]|uniref:hypothetical protein n=1 Tax=Allofournierella sp. TaxID=1940256 RepID=UPI003AB315F5